MMHSLCSLRNLSSDTLSKRLSVNDVIYGNITDKKENASNFERLSFRTFVKILRFLNVLQYDQTSANITQHCSNNSTCESSILEENKFLAKSSVTWEIIHSKEFKVLNEINLQPVLTNATTNLSYAIDKILKFKFHPLTNIFNFMNMDLVYANFQHDRLVFIKFFLEFHSSSTKNLRIDEAIYENPTIRSITTLLSISILIVLLVFTIYFLLDKIQHHFFVYKFKYLWNFLNIVDILIVYNC